MDRGVGRIDVTNRDVGPEHQPMPILERPIEQGREHARGEFDRHLLHPIERPPVWQLVEHVAGALADHPLHALEILRRDDRAHRHAALTVVGFVHLDEAGLLIALHLVFEPDAAELPFRREHLVVDRDLHDVLVAGHRPIRPEFTVGAIMHRVLAAQPFEVRLINVVLIEFGDTDINAVEWPRIRVFACVEIDIGVHEVLLGARPGWLQCCPSGILKTIPARSWRIFIWQERREFGCTAAAKLSMVSSCEPGSGRPVLSSHAASTKTWQVAQAHSPPQSASIPGTLLSTAPRISDVPTGTSTVWAEPLNSMYVASGMLPPWRLVTPRAFTCRYHHARVE